MELTASLVAHWQAVGFVHGTMNSDNLSVLGLTLDCGTCGFMERFDPEYTANSGTDTAGQYVYSQQVEAAKRSLVHLALALQSLVPMSGIQEAVQGFYPVYEDVLLRLYRRKLGLCSADSGDKGLLEQLMAGLPLWRLDYHGFFESLALVARGHPGPKSAVHGQGGDSDVCCSPGGPDAEASATGLAGLIGPDPGSRCPIGGHVPPAHRATWQAWLGQYRARLRMDGSTPAQRQALMDSANPRVVLRRHVVDDAISQALEGDYANVRAVLARVQDPFTT